MPNRYKLPSYRHVEVNGKPVRAYLTLAADIHGTWSAGYHAWLGEDEYKIGQYVVIGPTIEGQEDISTTLRLMRRALKDVAD